MFLNQFELRNFRNFDQLLVRFSPFVNVLLGANGQGKTNLIEGLYLLTQGASFRPGTTENFISHFDTGMESALLRGSVEKAHLEYDLQLQLQPHRRTWTVNGKKTTGSALAKNFPAVLFSPESLSVIKEGPEQRRLFVDELLSSHAPANLRIMTEYKSLLRTRNRILKECRSGAMDHAQAELLLSSMEPQFLKAAAYLTFARLDALRALHADFSRAMQAISNRTNVDISVDYLISGQNAIHWSAIEIHDSMHKRLQELRSQEFAAGASLVGPHKHDIRILLDGKDSRFFSSQGQQRALILSFKMARIVYHYRVHNFYPLLLLDDVLSELDIEKRGSLVAFLKTIRSQIFITTTDFSLPEELGMGDCTVFELHRGHIARPCSDSPQLSPEL